MNSSKLMPLFEPTESAPKACLSAPRASQRSAISTCFCGELKRIQLPAFNSGGLAGQKDRHDQRLLVSQGSPAPQRPPLLPILQTKKLQLLAGAERWLDLSSLQWGRTHGKQVSQTDWTVVLLEFPALSAEATVRARARRCRLHVPRCLTRARRVGFGRVGRDLKASSARGRFPASPAGHRPDSQAVKTELYVWGCYLKKIPTFLSDDPSPVSIS